ncbi:hypothetical protein K445DRAFT_18648 [Daldinia sp. EC12]|nr:hypothetical protein K445DRAFT_18648 [Daldinia sp. EC12]
MHEQEHLFHDRVFQPLNDVAREFLFARFAWSIFNSTTIPFLEVKGRPFTVRIRVEADSSIKLIDQTVSSIAALPSLRQLSSPSLGRKRTRDEPMRGEQRDDEWQHDDSDLFWSIEEGKVIHVNEINYPFGEPDFDNPTFE